MNVTEERLNQTGKKREVANRFAKPVLRAFNEVAEWWRPKLQRS